MSAVLRALLHRTTHPGISGSITVELDDELLAGFTTLDRWDGPEVVNALCAKGILTPADFGGQGELIGWELDSFDVTARITLPRPLLEQCWDDTQTEPLYGECERHGLCFIVEASSNPGFTGAPIYWWTLSCGCQDVDASADNIEAVR